MKKTILVAKVPFGLILLCFNCSQILSMRNGLNFHSMYMSGALQSLQASQMSIGFSSDYDPATKVESTMLPMNQDSAAAQTSFGVPGQHGSSQPSPVMPSLINVTNPLLINSSQSQRGSFQVPPSCEVLFPCCYSKVPKLMNSFAS